MSVADHKPEDHALIPIVEPRTRKAGRPDRRKREPQHYRCSCGTILPGNSRRQAKGPHQAHRRPLVGKS